MVCELNAGNIQYVALLLYLSFILGACFGRVWWHCYIFRV